MAACHFIATKAVEAPRIGESAIVAPIGAGYAGLIKRLPSERKEVCEILLVGALRERTARIRQSHLHCRQNLGAHFEVARTDRRPQVREQLCAGIIEAS